MFRLPIVKFFNRIFNRVTITVVLVALQVLWLLWAFWSFTAGRVWLNGALKALSILIVLYLVRKDENSAYKIGWIVLIGLLPLLGGALYLAFGNKAPAKYLRERMQKVEQAHQTELAQPEGQTDALDISSRNLSRYVAKFGPYPAWKDTAAHYFSCGEEMYPQLLADLDKAEKFIFLEFFILRSGKMWDGVEQILRRKAAQGVDVRLIYDDFGSLLGLPSDFVIRMEKAHIRCIPFNPVVPLVSLVMNHRDHRKIVVVDGKDTAAHYFSCGEEMYPQLLADLDKAEKFIFLEFFILRSGKMWDGVEQILRRKAAQGVDVRLIYDDFGSLLGLPSDFVIRMEKAHIRCIPFNPVVPLVSLVMNHRDHRKIVVVDGNVAYTGGVNLADEYINAEQRFGYWKDAAIRLEGAAVWNFTVMFLNAWNTFRPQETDYTAFAPTRLPAVQDGVVQPYADSPLDEEPLAETVYLDILSQAQRYVYIYTPYLAVGEEMLDALKNAAKRGVDVRLILPGIPDKKLVFRLSRSYYLPLLRAGVRIYEFTPGFLHAKCYVSDDRVAVVGSINMDYRSLFLHFECGTLLFHNSQIAALRKDVERTLPQCREIMRSDCRTNLPGTALDSVLRLLSPLM